MFWQEIQIWVHQEPSNFVKSCLLLWSSTGKNLVLISQTTFDYFKNNQFFLDILGPVLIKLTRNWLETIITRPKMSRQNWLFLNWSKVVWDINTKFLPVEDHNRRQLLTKFEGSWCVQIWISCQNILKLKWARRAQFLSYAFQILQKCIALEDAQMILLALLKNLSLNRIFKKSIQLLVHTGAVLDQGYTMWRSMWK